jgi:Rrf2 family transcriptional regulator, nitric oxide-sensitive transcriptional repressor
MRLTMFTDFGLRVLLVLASRRESLVTNSEISAAFDISDAHLLKVANALARTGWVETVRGRSGGLRLAVDPAQLSLRRIVEALESDFALVECFGTDNRCRLTGGCGVERALAGALRRFYEELERHSLADLVRCSPSLKKLPL